MKDASTMVREQRRPAARREDRPVNRTAVANLPSRTSAAAEEAAGQPLPVLRMLHIAALLMLPLSLYLVYAYGETYVYRGLLAIAVIGNLLILARIDAAQAQQLKKELQSLHTDNQTNHE